MGTLKWAGVILSALFLAAWPIASWWSIKWTTMSARRVVTMAARFGNLRVTHLRYDVEQTPGGPVAWPGRMQAEKYVPLGYLMPLRTWRPFAGRWQDTYGMITELVIPAWWPAAATILLTALAWRLDRRRAPGACVKCGYDLTGAPGGVCPECGVGS